MMRILVIAAAVGEVVTLWWTLRRYMVGLDGSLTLGDARWQPPLNAWLLLGINAAAMAWLAAVVLASSDVGEHVDDVLSGAGVVVDRQLTAGAELEVGEVRHR